MYDSMEIYNDAYEKAYFDGVMIDEELNSFLLDNDIYTPFDDMEIEKIKKTNEQLKLSAYKNFLNKKELARIKFLLRDNENKYSKILNKKNQFSHLTCSGVASYCRWNWIIERSTFKKDGSRYGWKDVSVSKIMSHYENSSISMKEFREVARSDDWRPIWNLGKKTGNLFGKPAYLMTKDQLVLCSLSSMYDNVYESPESPNEKVINDDDCLDGWFIDQRQKMEKHKKEQEVNSMITNPKIANAGEVYLVANSPEEAKEIHSLNSFQAEAARVGRMQTIIQKGEASDLDFTDVQRDLTIQKNQQSMDNIKRGR